MMAVGFHSSPNCLRSSLNRRPRRRRRVIQDVQIDAGAANLPRPERWSNFNVDTQNVVSRLKNGGLSKSVPSYLLQYEQEMEQAQALVSMSAADSIQPAVQQDAPDLLPTTKRSRGRPRSRP